jgi:hypothetical protein
MHAITMVTQDVYFVISYFVICYLCPFVLNDYFNVIRQISYITDAYSSAIMGPNTMSESLHTLERNCLLLLLLLFDIITTFRFEYNKEGRLKRIRKKSFTLKKLHNFRKLEVLNYPCQL